jgi:hypothetical protein
MNSKLERRGLIDGDGQPSVRTIERLADLLKPVVASAPWAAMNEQPTGMTVLLVWDDRWGPIPRAPLTYTREQVDQMIRMCAFGSGNAPPQAMMPIFVVKASRDGEKDVHRDVYPSGIERVH